MKVDIGAYLSPQISLAAGPAVLDPGGPGLCAARLAAAPFGTLGQPKGRESKRPGGGGPVGFTAVFPPRRFGLGVRWLQVPLLAAGGSGEARCDRSTGVCWAPCAGEAGAHRAERSVEAFPVPARPAHGGAERGGPAADHGGRAGPWRGPWPAARAAAAAHRVAAALVLQRCSRRRNGRPWARIRVCMLTGGMGQGQGPPAAAVHSRECEPTLSRNTRDAASCCASRFTISSPPPPLAAAASGGGGGGGMK